MASYSNSKRITYSVAPAYNRRDFDHTQASMYCKFYGGPNKAPPGTDPLTNTLKPGATQKLASEEPVSATLKSPTVERKRTESMFAKSEQRRPVAETPFKDSRNIICN